MKKHIQSSKKLSGLTMFFLLVAFAAASANNISTTNTGALVTNSVTEHRQWDSRAIQLQHFSIKKNGCTVHLDWNTSMEANLKDIQIERSNNGGAFMPVATLEATGGGHYSYSEDGLGTGNYEYRLKFNSHEGESFTSWVDTVSLVCDYNIQVFPARTNDTVFISGGISGASINIYDAKGSGVMKTTANGQMTALSLGNLPAGTYFIGIIKNNELIKQETIVKQ